MTNGTDFTIQKRPCSWHYFGILSSFDSTWLRRENQAFLWPGLLGAHRSSTDPISWTILNHFDPSASLRTISLACISILDTTDPQLVRGSPAVDPAFIGPAPLLQIHPLFSPRRPHRSLFSLVFITSQSSLSSFSSHLFFLLSSFYFHLLSPSPIFVPTGWFQVWSAHQSLNSGSSRVSLPTTTSSTTTTT